MPTSPDQTTAPRPSAAEIRDRIGSVPVWYHTFDFGQGVRTEGYFDHTGLVHKLPFPDSLAGKRCLDLASSDGFFAFEMARRGGDVVSVDLEDTREQDHQGTIVSDAGDSGARSRFEIAKWATGLEVERVNRNLYDVGPDMGEFDFVFIGNILLHLSDPGRALKAARSVCRGQLISFETISLSMTLLRPRSSAAVLGEFDEARWWTPNVRGHKRLLAASNFEVKDAGFPVMQPFGTGFKKLYPPLKRHPTTPWGMHLAFVLFNRPFGVPCQWLLCE